MADEEQNETPQDEQNAEGTPEEPEVEQSPEEGAAADETGAEPQADEPQADEPTEEQADEPSEAGAEEPSEAQADEPADAQPEQPAPKRAGKKKKKDEPEVIPGEHLEPDLVLEEQQEQPAGPGERAVAEAEAQAESEPAPEAEGEPEPEPAERAEPAAAARTPLDLAADARYRATGKRKSAVARVVLKPGAGSYTVNGRELDDFFPRTSLRKIVRQPLEAAGYTERMDVVATIHGGGVSSQAGALRHGVARALVEADPNLRGDLKREGFLRRDPRVKERKKAGLKKARKRPQFSKR